MPKYGAGLAGKEWNLRQARVVGYLQWNLSFITRCFSQIVQSWKELYKERGLRAPYARDNHAA
jgi:hypothetical protein